ELALLNVHVEVMHDLGFAEGFLDVGQFEKSHGIERIKLMVLAMIVVKLSHTTSWGQEWLLASLSSAVK
ncbi:hypothetical protein, partial [Rhizobium sp. BK376]|uniref:hypothetical protein n=1 Tax=Rhizobium sp. BK376 TaxID=2512149 RepID=UPI0010E3A952